MKKILVLMLAGGALFSCQTSKVQIAVSNDLPQSRNREIVEVPMKKIPKTLRNPEEIVLTDAQGKALSFQKTYDNKLIFLANVPGYGVSKYTLAKGTPEKFPNMAQGRQYPERLDDMAWENDLMGFRAYGPALQKTGEKSFGYDLFIKRGTEFPVLDTLYAKELDHVTRQRSRDLKKTNPEESLRLWRSISYHYDRGHGLDCYSVGPTLGAGVTALMVGDSIVYPYCYKEYEILDNGPLRFTVKLTFNPENYEGQEVVEQRLISLDVGSNLNKSEILYKGLKKEAPIATGFVMHDSPQRIYANKGMRILSYTDPTNTADKSNGEIFLGAVFPKKVKVFKKIYFPASKAKKIKAYGHVVAENEYKPNEVFTYYFGAGWTKANMPNQQAWIDYLKSFEQRIDSPLKVSVQR
ncbi:DUF4861 domain-containing protein [Ornithobacterium rhinotracheale]|uniref:DUF4861 domain-containing protein n=1 Tax=Ornithobacterium rhinotracheale TaxID=28251 RepID=UPI001FF4EED4|nr:DUF4861 domain-containing protein [Ornithobacterium rhinotracheale]MCK0201975.1 DUF4861 domain-containing protein [Ornithobacterium rhinotracheale]